MEAVVRFDTRELDLVLAGLHEAEKLPEPVVREIENAIWTVIPELPEAKRTRVFSLVTLVAMRTVVERILLFLADRDPGDPTAILLTPCLAAQTVLNEALGTLMPQREALVLALAACETPTWPRGQPKAETALPAAVDVGCPHFDVVHIAPDYMSAELSSCKVRPEDMHGCTVTLSKVYPVEALPILVCRWLLARQESMGGN